MIAVDDYVSGVLATAVPLPLERVPVSQAIGRTLGAATCALLHIPPFDNASMDGFAVRFADVAGASPTHPVALRVVADIAAGSTADPALPPGTTARIMTGAPVPSDADAVVPFEATKDGLSDSLRVAVVREAPRFAGAHIRRRGEDLSVGAEVLPDGTLLGPLQIAALIAAGTSHVDCRRRPRVLVISTGVELTAPGTTPGAGQIPDSNSALLALSAAEAGADVVGCRRVDDDPTTLLALLADAPPADVVISSGGLSAGAFEPVRLALDGIVAFEKVAMQPGKPQAFGRLPGGALFFGLPGNPVSVAVSFEAIVRPALLALQARSPVHRPTLTLPAATTWRSPVGRQQYLPITVDRSDTSAWRVRPATPGGSGSHLAGGLGRAEGYAVIPPPISTVQPGDPVDVWLTS